MRIPFVCLFALACLASQVTAYKDGESVKVFANKVRVGSLLMRGTRNDGCGVLIHATSCVVFGFGSGLLCFSIANFTV
jgi:hypothetical protein